MIKDLFFFLWFEVIIYITNILFMSNGIFYFACSVFKKNHVC